MPLVFHAPLDLVALDSRLILHASFWLHCVFQRQTPADQALQIFMKISWFSKAVSMLILTAGKVEEGKVLAK